MGGQARPEAGSHEPAGWCWDRQAGLLSQEDGPVEPALWTSRDRARCSKPGRGPSLAPTPCCQTMHRAPGPQGPHWSEAGQNPALRTLHSGMGQNTCGAAGSRPGSHWVTRLMGSPGEMGGGAWTEYPPHPVPPEHLSRLLDSGHRVGTHQPPQPLHRLRDIGLAPGLGSCHVFRARGPQSQAELRWQWGLPSVTLGAWLPASREGQPAAAGILANLSPGQSLPFYYSGLSPKPKF